MQHRKASKGCYKRRGEDGKDEGGIERWERGRDENRERTKEMRVQGRKKERRERGRVPEAGVCKKLEEEKRLMKRDEEEERRRAVRDEGEKNKEHEKGEEKVKVEE